MFVFLEAEIFSGGGIAGEGFAGGVAPAGGVKKFARAVVGNFDHGCPRINTDEPPARSKTKTRGLSKTADHPGRNCSGESKAETGPEVGKTRPLQFRRIFRDAGFKLTNLSVSGCDIHPFARPSVRVQFFVNQPKQIALIGTALFFETGIG